MPVWLQVILAVWGGVAPLVGVGWKWARGLQQQVSAIGQWFDPRSALGQQFGTLPAQVGELRLRVDEIVDSERVVQRIASIERKQDTFQITQETMQATQASMAGQIDKIHSRLRQIETSIGQGGPQ